jgi:acetyl-CoA carboxylase/biotin carboxylase 1
MINCNQAQPVRTGVIASFPNVDAMMKGFSKVVSLLPFDSQEFLERHGANTEAPNVVNIALHIFNEEDDIPESDWNKQVVDSVNNQDSVLKRRGVHRISIFLCRPGQVQVSLCLAKLRVY